MNIQPKSLVILTFLLVIELVGQDGAFQANQMPNSSPAQAVSGGNTKPNRRETYVADEACRGCHRDQVESYHRTAHYLTSRLPDQNAILGNFGPDANILKTSNPDLFFRMDVKDGGFFETAVEGVEPYRTSRTERFGLVVGSGGKGQTFLFWKGDLLFQLPVSYWNEVGWVNSPGYPDGVAYFDRPVIPRCLECHGTYFESLAPPGNRYRESEFVVGVSCEKCHGPGRGHIQHPSTKAADGRDPAILNRAILNPARFSRDRQMDLCAWCHAGHGEPILPTFSYVPGEALDKYIQLPQPDPDAPIDVHGSQVELLKRSRCFQSSTMTCLTCHDVHRTQKDPVAFSRHCLECHKVENHRKLGHPLGNNCVDCHMPKQPTKLIVFHWNGRKASPEVRNHWIQIYPEASRDHDGKP
jgi:hypothetical protein